VPKSCLTKPGNPSDIGTWLCGLVRSDTKPLFAIHLAARPQSFAVPNTLIIGEHIYASPDRKRWFD